MLPITIVVTTDHFHSRKAQAFYIRCMDCELILECKDAVRVNGGLVVLNKKADHPAKHQLWYEDESGLIRSQLNGYVLEAKGE